MVMPRRVYESHRDDGTRWPDFEFRAGDVVVSAPAKSGTTWTQMICALLLGLPAPLGENSPWLDARSMPREEVFAALAAQRGRRVVKTHTPLDGVPTVAGTHYVVVARHPLDAAVSLYHQMGNLDRAELRRRQGFTDARGPVPELPPLRGWLREWVRADPDPVQVPTGLPGMLHHPAVAWPRRDDPNVLLVHYADLSADLPGQIRRIAGALGAEVTDEADLAREAGFDAMRAHADQLISSTLPFKDRTAFFRSGRNGAGPEALSPRDLDLYHERAAALLTPGLFAWLHRPVG